MSQYIIFGIAAVALHLLFKLLYATDVPKIKNLPEIPGLPIFGNLYQLGTDHARVAKKWATKYGPVFQTRLGNRVRPSPVLRPHMLALDEAKKDEVIV
jgi:phenylacetate 2-hydroxylase